MDRRFAMKSLLSTVALAGTSFPSGLQGMPFPAETETLIRNPKAFGARGDGRTKDTAAIQQAIDQAEVAGGGIVYVAPGTYLIGTVVLKKNVTVYLEAGAKLLGSTSLSDYSMPPEAAMLINNPNTRHLIFAFRADNIGLIGPGTVDGQSSRFIAPLNKPAPAPEDLWHLTSGAQWERRARVSPMIEIAQCSNVRIEDVTLQNSVGWALRPIGCNSVVIRGVKIRNPDYAPNADGIDPSSCENVMISDCDVDTGDDALCIKSDNPYGDNKIARNITVTNCILSSACNGFKIGSEGPHGFENITFSNSVVYSRQGKRDDQRVISAIDIVMPDGGWIEGVTISNISIRNARIPVCIRLQNITGEPQAEMRSWMRSIMISDVQAFGAIVTSSITGIPAHPVEDVTLRNICIQTDEQGQAGWAENVVPEREHGYAEGSAFGRFPSFGFYCRHVIGLRFSGIDVHSKTGDPRPMIHCEDVTNLELSALGGTPPSTGAEVIRLRNVRNSALHGNYARAGTGTYLRVEGEQSHEISLFGNDLHQAEKRLWCSPEVSSAAVLVDGLPVRSVND
jgi:hypothetical protein